MKKNIYLYILLVFSLLAFTTKDKTTMLSQKWVMSEMQVEGKLYSEEMMNRQRQNGLETIVQFNKNGTAYLFLRTPKGKTTKRNKWQFIDNQTKLVIQPEGDEPAQTFMIEKITSKKLTLSILDQGTKQIFTYKSIKD